jgi:hypothetical protein
MSQVMSAKQVCETALRAINAFPITESSADGEQLREAMKWLDMILAQNAGANRLLFLIPAPGAVSFVLTNGIEQYDLANALGANAPVDGMQFPVAAYLLEPTGTSVVGFSASIPAGIAVGQAVTDVTSANLVPPGTTVAAINAAANQITLSGPSLVASGDALSFATTPSPTQLVSTGTVGGPSYRAGTPTYRRRPIDIVTRDIFLAKRLPNENGRPHMVYIDRLPDNQLILFPTPLATDTQLYILELDVQTYAPNVAPAGVTGTQPQGEVLTNFRQAWNRYLCAQLAHDLGSGPIYKIGEASLNRFGNIAAQAKAELERFENREHEDTPPIGEAYDSYDYDTHEHHHHHRY